MLEQLVAQVHDQQLRRQRLTGIPRRTLALTPSTFGARVRIEQLLPCQIGDDRGAEAIVLGHVLDVYVHRLQRALRPLAREQHVEC